MEINKSQPKSRWLRRNTRRDRRRLGPIEAKSQLPIISLSLSFAYYALVEEGGVAVTVTLRLLFPYLFLSEATCGLLVIQFVLIDEEFDLLAALSLLTSVYERRSCYYTPHPQ